MKKHINRILSIILSLSFICQPCMAVGNNYSKIKNNTSSLSNKKMSTKDKIAYYGLAAGSLMVLTSAILSLQPKEELDELGINNGLYNVGNSCYMNAMLQQLYSIDAFREWIIHFHDNRPKNNMNEQTLNKIEAMKSIFKYMSGEEKTKLEPLMHTLGHIDKQGDSLECIQVKWSDVFDLFIEKKYNGKNYSSLNTTFEDDFLLAKVFISENKGNLSLRDILNTQDRQKISYEEYQRNKSINLCNRIPKQIHTLNDQFMITLNRANYDNYSHHPTKITTPVEPNKVLTSKDINEEEDKNNTYKLTGIIIHNGSCNGGHYYSYKFNAKDKKWYEYNDDTVTQVNYDDIKNDICINATAFTYTDTNKL